MEFPKSDFDYTKLAYDDRLLIHNALAETTARHILANEGLFQRREFDPAANKSQMLETTHLYPAPAKFEGDMGIRALATAASGNLYSAIREEQRRQRPFISMVERARRAGENIMHVVTHQMMIDVAEEDAAWSDETQHENWQNNTGLGISRGVTTIEAFGMAASEVAEKVGHVFMSFPRTKTIMDLVKVFKEQQEARLLDNPDAHYIDIDKLIDTNNRDVRTEMREWLGVDTRSRIQNIGRHTEGKNLFLAIAGATYGVEYGDDHRPKRITMPKSADGILDVVKHGLSVPSVLWDQDEPIVEYGEPREIRSEPDLRAAEEWQRATLARRLNLPDDAVSIEQNAA